MNTPYIWTLSMDPLVSILKGFDCNNNNDDTKLLKHKHVQVRFNSSLFNSEYIFNFYCVPCWPDH